MMRFARQYHGRPGNEGGCQTTFAVDPNIDLIVAALLDMISQEPSLGKDYANGTSLKAVKCR
jgi:hypothetical protein